MNPAAIFVKMFMIDLLTTLFLGAVHFSLRGAAVNCIAAGASDWYCATVIVLAVHSGIFAAAGAIKLLLYLLKPAN